jgi:hypothetical protein
MRAIPEPTKQRTAPLVFDAASFSRSAALFFINAVAILCCYMIQASPTSAGVTLQWDPSVTPGVIGYRLYSGTTTGVYTQQTEIGNATMAAVSNLVPGTTYFFAVTDYTATGLESTTSNEVAYQVPATLHYSSKVAVSRKTHGLRKHTISIGH